MNITANDIFVQDLSYDAYVELLRSRWSIYNSALQQNAWQAAKKCLILQNEYLNRGMIKPIEMTVQNVKYIFLEIVPEKFENADEKKQFLKEVAFLLKLEKEISQVTPLDLSPVFGNYNPQSPESCFLTQLFIQKV